MESGVGLNPWFSMWTKPRETIQQLVDRNLLDRPVVLLLAVLAGINSTLDRAVARSLGDALELWQIFATALIGGGFAGIITLYVGAFLIRSTGAWIGGKGTPEQIRTAMAWGNVPAVWAMILWLPEIVIFGEEMFTTPTPRMEASPGLALLLVGFSLVEIVIAIWAFVVLLKGLGQVQGFSAWKALGNCALAVLLVLVPIVLVVALLAGIG